MIVPVRGVVGVNLLQEHSHLLLMHLLVLLGGWRGETAIRGARYASCEPQLLSELGCAVATTSAALAINCYVFSCNAGRCPWSAGRVALRAEQGLLALLQPL